jgi:hypothetical protein
MEATTIIVIGSIVLIFGFIWAMRKLGQRMVGTSKQDAETIQRLIATGAKARATIAAATPTGLTVNNHNVQVSVDFWMEPLDGSPSFQATKKMFFYETQFPRQGAIWPSWYDRQDPSIFAVGAPGKLDPGQIELYREFGIPHPLDKAGGA